MKSRLNLSLTRRQLLPNIPSMELRTPYHAYDLQSFSLELSSYGDHIRIIALGFFIVGLVAISSALSFEAWLLNPAIINENALLELAQSSFLILATLLQGWRAFNTHDSSLKRDIHLGLALFAFALLLREIDVEYLGSGVFWNALETILRLIALLAILSFALRMSRQTKLVMDNLGHILLSPTILLSVVACVFYACSLPFDRELFEMDTHLSKWFEETFELNACLLFFCASMAGNIKSVVINNTGAQCLHRDVMNNHHNKNEYSPTR